MKKKVLKGIEILLTIACLAAVMTGCTTSKSYTYTVENGDMIKVELDTSTGWDLSSELPFEVTCPVIDTDDDVKVAEGTLIHGEYYEQYAELAETDADCEILETGNKDGNEYIFWKTPYAYYYVMKIGNSNTGLFLDCGPIEGYARESFNRLVISVE